MLTVLTYVGAIAWYCLAAVTLRQWLMLRRLWRQLEQQEQADAAERRDVLDEIKAEYIMTMAMAANLRARHGAMLAARRTTPERARGSRAPV